MKKRTILSLLILTVISLTIFADDTVASLEKLQRNLEKQAAKFRNSDLHNKIK